MPEWSHALPPCDSAGVEQFLRGRGVGQRDPYALALCRARFRSFWCSSIRKPGAKVRLIMRSPWTSRIREDANPPISAWRTLAGIGAHLGGEHQRLRDRLDVERDDDLVGDLGRLAVAIAADERDVLAHLLEHGLTASNTSCAAADHDRQAPRLGADLAARNGRVEIVVAGLVDPPREFLGRDRRDRAHVDDDLARRRAETLGDAARPEQHFLDLRRVGHHGDDDVGLLRDLARAVASLAAGRDQIGRNVAGAS